MKTCSPRRDANMITSYLVKPSVGSGGGGQKSTNAEKRQKTVNDLASNDVQMVSRLFKIILIHSTIILLLHTIIYDSLIKMLYITSPKAMRRGS